MSKQRSAAILAAGLSAWLAVILLTAAAILSFTDQAAAQQDSTDSTLSAPTLTAEAGDDGVDLRWTAVTGAARYELWAWTSAAGWWDIGGDNLTGASFTHADVTEGVTYWYAVRAVTAGDDTSDWSVYASATAGTPALPAPTLTAQATANGAELSWTAVTGAVRYELWAWDNVNLWQQIGGENLTDTSYAHADVMAGTTYYCTVRAVNADAGTSDWSTYASATIGSHTATPSATPTLQTQQQQGDEAMATPTPTGTPTPTPTLTPNAQQQRNEPTATPTATPTPTAEQPGQNVPATGSPSISGTAEVCKTLTADVSNIMDENGMVNASFSYNWYAGAGYFRAAVVRDPKYIVQSRDVGLTISVTVNFDDDAGNSETVDSLETATVIAATNPGKPKPPVQVRALTPESGKLSVSWTHPYSLNCGDGGSTVTGFKVQWKEAADDWDTPADVSEATVAYGSLNASYTISGLTDGVEYTVRVRATNAVGDGAASSEVSATPQATQ